MIYLKSCGGVGEYLIALLCLCYAVGQPLMYSPFLFAVPLAFTWATDSCIKECVAVLRTDTGEYTSCNVYVGVRHAVCACS